MKQSYNRGFVVSSGSSRQFGTAALALSLVVLCGSAVPVQAGGPCGNNFCEGIFCFLEGIKNTPIGTAKLGLDDRCVMQITEIGTTGEDGLLQTEYDGSSAQVVNVFEAPNWSRAQVGSMIRAQFAGMPAAGGTPQLIADLRITVPDAPEKSLIEAAFPDLNSRSFDVVVYKEGGLNNSFLQLPAVQIGFDTIDIQRLGSSIEPQRTAGATTAFATVVAFTGTTHVEVGGQGGGGADGDTVVIIPVAATVNLASHTAVLTNIANLPKLGVVFEYGGIIVQGCEDRDGDGYGNPGSTSCPRGPQRDCNDTNPNIHPGRPEICNRIDDNCNLLVDEGFDADLDSFTTCNGDCDDHNPNINPRASEVCNGVDDDCDGTKDDGFCLPSFQLDPDGSGVVQICIPIGEPCSVGTGACETTGIVTCPPAPGVGVQCVGTPLPPQTEGPPGSPTCTDQRDNDCDTHTDFEDPNCQSAERCDGFDNNNNGQIDETWANFLGNPCFVGVGACRSQGVYECRADGTDVQCSATPNEPGVEGPPGTHTCRDGVDNDCDGLTDCRGPTGLAGDPDCHGVELCDGRDNNCNGQVDEPFAGVLGDVCARGIGACLQVGTMTCSPDGSSTTCSAVPLAGFYEGPGDCSCSDGLDNDCDGLTDAADPNCGSATLQARCSLEECRPKTSNDCYSGHRIAFDVVGGGADTALVTAELLAMREDGEILATLPVENGDIAQLEARKLAFGMTAQSLVIPRDLDTFQDWDDCDTGPQNPTYPERCEPFDGNCDASIDLLDYQIWQNNYGTSLNVHRVFAPIPVLRIRADNGQNVVEAYCSNSPYIDVVRPHDEIISESEGDIINVVAAIPNIDPDTLFIKVDGQNVLTELGLNPVTAFPGGPYSGSFNLTTPGCQDRRIVEVCDLTVRTRPMGLLSRNTLTMTIRGLGPGGHVVVIDGAKLPGTFPNLPGGVCAEDDTRDNGIAKVIGIIIRRPNDQEVVIGPSTPVNGVACHGLPLSRVAINDREVSVATQTFFDGDEENSADTYRLNFQTALPLNDLRAELDGAPPTPGRLDPGANRMIGQVSDERFNTSFDRVNMAVGPVVANASMFSGQVADDIRDELSQVAAETAAATVDKAFTLAMNAGALTTFFSELCQAIGPDLATDLEERLDGYTSDSFTIPTPWPLCDVKNAKMHVNSVDIDPTAFDCQITPLADKLRLTITLPAFTAGVHFSGHCDEYFIVCLVEVIVDTDVDFEVPPITVTFEITEAQILSQQQLQDVGFSLGGDPVTIAGTLDDDSEVNCLVGIILDILDFILTVITFGAWDPGLDEFEFELSDEKLKERMGEKNGDMREFEEFKFDNDELIPKYESKLDAELNEVQITPQGVALAVSASFETTNPDPTVGTFPGTPLSPAPLPLPLIPGADDVTVGISDDVFNQLLASLVDSGRLKTLFEEVRVLGDFLPEPDRCDDLGPLLEPRCVGMLGGDCNQFVLASRRELCEEWKQRMEDRVLSPGSAVIVYGKVEVPPKILIDDNPATQDEVEVALRYSQISIGIFVDRDGDGNISGSLASLPACFGATPSTQGECAIWEACLNVNVVAQLFLPPNELLLRMQVLDVSHELSTGTVCGGIDEVGDELIDETAQSEALDRLNERLREGTPDLKTKGLDFGGLVTFQNARLISIENDGNPDFQDYIAITGDLQVVAPK